MITVTFNKSADIFEKRLLTLIKDPPVSRISKIVQDDIKDEAVQRGWKRIPATIKRRKVSNSLYEVFLGGKEKDKDVSVYQHRGTKAHFIRPKKKKALSWVANPGIHGKRFFSKGHRVSGIKASNFFTVYPSTLAKIRVFMNQLAKI